MMNVLNPTKRLLLTGAFIASLQLFVSTVSALTMDFDDTVSTSDVALGPVLPYEEDGLRLRDGTTGDANALFDSLFDGRADRPTDYFGWILGAEVVLETVSLAPFSLTSFQYGALSLRGLYDMQVTGFFAGGGTISETLAVIGDAWQTHNFSSSWTNLSSVVFLADGSDGAIDTIVVNGASVPDSGATLVLLASGLLGLAWLRRRMG